MSSNYRFFTNEELACSHCLEQGITDSHENMDEQFMEMVIHLREELGFPFIVTSAYRCPEHPIEKAKSSPGAHSSGTAMDIKASGKKAYKLLSGAFEYKFLGIGSNQRGDHGQRFVHIDMWMDAPPGQRPWTWSY